MKNILIIDCGSNKTKEIISIVEKNNCFAERWYLYYPTIDFKLELEDLPSKVCLIKIVNEQIEIKEFNATSLKTFNAIIFSGGGLLQEIQKEIKNFFTYLLEVKIPTLGICFGHQVIGLVYGSEIYKLENKVSGNYKVDFITTSKLIKKNKAFDNSLFAKNHTEAITIPKGFELIAKSESCQNEMMQHQTKPIYGVQFHPEVSDVSGENIIRQFLMQII